MREHKYKAYVKKLDEVFDAEQINLTNSAIIVITENAGRVLWKFEDIELMEFVGNFQADPFDESVRNDVYTGQIVDCWSIYSNMSVYDGELIDEPHEIEEIGVVTWDEENLTYIVSGKEKTLLGDFQVVEVIGNIYQDKHLLEG